MQVNATYGVNPIDFISKWVAQRAADASSLGKPLIIEEFGKQLQDFSAASIAKTRDPIFAGVYASLQNLESVKGVYSPLSQALPFVTRGSCPLCLDMRLWWRPAAKSCSICWNTQYYMDSYSMLLQNRQRNLLVMLLTK